MNNYELYYYYLANHNENMPIRCAVLQNVYIRILAEISCEMTISIAEHRNIYINIETF